MTYFTGCAWISSVPCDLDGPRETLCSKCLTFLVKSERPADWTPRIKPQETK